MIANLQWKTIKKKKTGANGAFKVQTVYLEERTLTEDAGASCSTTLLSSSSSSSLWLVRVFLSTTSLSSSLLAITQYNNAIPPQTEKKTHNFAHYRTRTCPYFPVTCAVRGSLSPVFSCFICCILFYFPFFLYFLLFFVLIN